MMATYQTPAWALELPAGWTAAQREDHVVIALPFPAAQLRLTPYRDETDTMTPEKWVRWTEQLHRKRGRTVIARKCGDFHGYEVRFAALGDWIRGWALVANGVGVDIDYRCPEAEAKRDDAEIDAVLSTLRLLPIAT